MNARRPCRTRGCSRDRPLVPVGCAYLWDRCSRCARRILSGTPLSTVGAGLDPIDPWAERVHELLDRAEVRAA